MTETPTSGALYRDLDTHLWCSSDRDTHLWCGLGDTELDADATEPPALFRFTFARAALGADVRHKYCVRRGGDQTDFALKRTANCSQQFSFALISNCGTCSSLMHVLLATCIAGNSGALQAGRSTFSVRREHTRVARYYRYTGVPRYLGVPVRHRGIYEYKYSTAVCSHHTVFF